MALDATHIKSITHTKVDFHELDSDWFTACGVLQAYGINYPSVRIALAATVAVESMFDKNAQVPIAPGTGDYTGRGWIQLTGLPNYQRYGPIIKQDLVKYPVLACEYSVAIAAAYFKDHHIDIAANRGDWHRVRYLVNGEQMNLLDKFLNYVWQMIPAEYGSP